MCVATAFKPGDMTLLSKTASATSTAIVLGTAFSAHQYHGREPKDRVFPVYVLLGSQKSTLPCFDARHYAIEVKAHSCDDSAIRRQA